MAIKLNPGRQYPLAAATAFTFEDLDGANAVVAVRVPRGAIILGGSLNVTTAFDAAQTISVGVPGADAKYGAALATSATGAKALTATGEVSDATVLTVKPSDAMTKGAATLVVQYILADRANEAQP